MKKLLLALMIITFAFPAFAGPTIPRDGEGVKIQVPAWDATLSQAVLTNVSQNITISGRIWYEFISLGDCKGRLMNDAVKANWPQFAFYAKSPFRGGNWADSTTYKTKFLNVSGCTGDFRAQ